MQPEPYVPPAAPPRLSLLTPDTQEGDFTYETPIDTRAIAARVAEQPPGFDRSSKRIRDSRSTLPLPETGSLQCA